MRSTLSTISIGEQDSKVKLLGEIISVRSLPKRKLILHKKENGPGGIRTRICDLDRVLCSRYTTGPERSFGVGTALGKVMRHNFVGWVPNWEGIRFLGLRSGQALDFATALGPFPHLGDP